MITSRQRLIYDEQTNAHRNPRPPTFRPINNMALQLLPIFQIIIIFYAPGFLAYNPIYGTKRYGRSTNRLTTSYDPYPYQSPMFQTQRYPLNYYKLYPYSQSYPEDYYYPQETYPVYYPAPRTSKYEVYQAVLPYYYQERPVTRPGYGYYGYADPMVDLQEEMIQEAEREEREEAQPIGHESYYENEAGNGDEEALDEVNAAFLQNLILSQMYQDSVDGEKDVYDQYADADYDGYGKFEDINDKPAYNSEDEDVRELKQLTKQHSRKQQLRNQARNDEIHWFQQNEFKNQKNDNKRSDGNLNRVPDVYMGPVVYSDRKPIVKLSTTTTTPTTTAQSPISTEEPKRDARGQKEEFQMRPATPVRHPFTSPVLAMMSKNEVEKKRTPSVYDTIKHMLDMEKSLENVNEGSEVNLDYGILLRGKKYSGNDISRAMAWKLYNDVVKLISRDVSRILGSGFLVARRAIFQQPPPGNR
ncbi:hypothetical protein NQ318_015724 [Aromia moschata]|uniref:Uncharacterized protein n=1 Tax=Aromia moschata TaxID=1265417 RepID=A0AAV8Y057_9CUCU|nr:hypothetical protein NQ318_015724 [Aromia moschata]